MLDLVAIEPVQLTFDYSEYSPELAASLEQHALNMESFTKRYASNMGKELAEAKAEIHAEKQTGWAKWVEGRLGISVRWADKVIEKYERPKIENLVPNFLPEAAPRIDLPVEIKEPLPSSALTEHEASLAGYRGYDRWQEAQTWEEKEPISSSLGFYKQLETPVKSPALTALQSSETNEWYTPAEYANIARELMGGIDVDPASCEEANRIIQAKKFYTKKDNGLLQTWRGRVWLNPPYGFEDGRSNQDVWSQSLIERYENGKVTGVTTEAVLLVNANTEAKWFQPLYNYLICFTNHRIRFYNSNGESSQPTQGNALVYFGKQRKRFIELFSRFGTVVERAK